MTPEQRLDRLERIAKLFVRAGQRARRQMRDQTIKIDRLVDLQNHLISLQIGNEERSAKHDAKINTLLERSGKDEDRISMLLEGSAKHDAKINTLLERSGKDEDRISMLLEGSAKHDEKISTLLDFQQRNELRFERNEERLNSLSEQTERSFAELANAQAQSEQKIKGLAEAQTVLAEAQVSTDHKLTELIDIIRKGHNGDSPANNN